MVVKRGGYEGILGIEEVLCAGFSRDVSKKEKVCTTGYGYKWYGRNRDGSKWASGGVAVLILKKSLKS